VDFILAAASDQSRVDPKHAFVVIKHGLKMTGMPAHGAMITTNVSCRMTASL
jgi:hypothetical protein